jgi:hypothetical protein
MEKGRCMKCKKQVEIHNGKEVRMKTGNYMLKGKCKCGCTVCRIIGKKK